MPLDILLFILRLLAAVALYAFLAALLLTLARDVTSAAGQAQAPTRSAGQLVIVEHNDEILLEAGARYPLASLTTLGRATTCSVVIPDSFASNDHAHVFQRGGQWWLEDMHSRNGTILNELPVNEPMVLSSGDVISIGRVKLRVEF